MLKKTTRLFALLLALTLALGLFASADAATLIGKKEARRIALEDAGYEADAARITRERLHRNDDDDDDDDDDRYYEIEFYALADRTQEFDYEINARTGVIEDVDHDAESYSPRPIGLSAAKKIAVTDAGQTQKGVRFIKAKLDKDGDDDDDAPHYDIEFFVKAERLVQFDYEIHAITGKILEKDTDVEDYRPAPISRAKAKEIALKHAGFTAGQVRFTDVELDDDDDDDDGYGRHYEVEFRVKATRMEYEYIIDAVTGDVLFSKSEYDD